MKRSIILFIFFISIGATTSVWAQTDSVKSWVISYQIKVATGKKSANIGDLYDGGSKTIFIDSNKARLRLVSLMRIESVYFLLGKDSSIDVYRVKESSKTPSSKKYDLAGWKKFHVQYDSAVFVSISDSMVLLGHICYKGNLQLTNGKVIEIWYAKHLPPIPQHVEPAFVSVPGMVLQYEYKDGKVAVTYTASSIKNMPINPTIFDIEQRHLKNIVL